MKTKIIFGFIAFIVVIMLLGLSFGWFDVFYTKTVGKAQQNANREVFEQSQSFIEGKRQELTKYHHEWVMDKDQTDKLAIESTIRSDFANFDENKIIDPELHQWLDYCLHK